jgi:glycosyltransferase involved in cell wall biosynthesis
MIWTILIIKKSDNGWYINYIEQKILKQISINNLQNFVDVIVFDPKIKFDSKYVSVIDNYIEISDSFVSDIYNIIFKSNADCIGLKGLNYIDGNSCMFSNISDGSSLILPITTLNPIKLDIIVSKLQNIHYYINSENLSNVVQSIDSINTPVIFMQDTTNKLPFSIIITAYQTQNYIEECLDSIENQSYFKENDNYEILVGVDACQDTFDKLNEIKHKYRNLKIYMMNDNKGTYITTNTLIGLTKHENIIRFDSDDIMTPNLVKELVKDKGSSDIVLLGYLDFEDNIIGKKLAVAGIIYFKKSVMDIAGGYQPWRCAADTELISRLANKVKIHQLKKAVFYRRIHENSLTRRDDTKHDSEIRNYYTSLIKRNYSDNEIKIERIVNKFKTNNNQFKCIITRNNDTHPFKSTQAFILSKFSNNPKYNNSIVLLGYNLECDMLYYRTKYPKSKIIIYQLEQLFNNESLWYNTKSDNNTIVNRTKHIQNILNKCDEIWDYDLDNIEFLKKEGFSNIKHVPFEYSSNLIKKNTTKEYKYDILFYGSLNDKRIEYLNLLLNKYELCMIVPDHCYNKYKNTPLGKYLVRSIFNPEKLFKYIFESKLIINIHYYNSLLQEQVRLFELLINNKLIISEKSRRNYFGDLIVEFDDKNDMIRKIDHYLKNNNWINNNISNKFKEMKKIKVGAVYNTFYGLEFIEKSINSIKDCVDYFVIIHQHVSIDLKTKEPSINKDIFEKLKRKNLDIDIIYLDPEKDLNGINNINHKHAYILKKRNLGLEYCKKNGCNFIIPLDTDECYNSSELKEEIIYMYENNIDTLYSPIYAYYYDEYHYFEDTYHVPSVYRVDDRVFKKQPTSILVDPVRKLEERNFKISKMYMHHYTYMKETYHDKIKSGIRTTNPNIKEQVIQIGDYLLNEWEEGKPAFVFLNDMNNGGNTILSYVELKKIN